MPVPDSCVPSGNPDSGESIPHNLLWIRRTLSCHRAGIPDNSKPWPDDILLPDSLTRYNLPFCEENSHPLQHFLPMSRTLSCNNLPVPYFLSYAGSGIRRQYNNIPADKYPLAVIHSVVSPIFGKGDSLCVVSCLIEIDHQLQQGVMVDFLRLSVIERIDLQTLLM